MNIKNALVNVLGIVVALGIGFAVGYAMFGNRTVINQITAGGSAVGTTQNSAKIVSVVMAPSTSAASSTSIYNGSGYDRAIQGSFAYCTSVGTSKTYLTGTGLATLQLGIATTATAIHTASTDYAGLITIATSTAYQYVSSTTEGVIYGVSRLWPNSTYLTFTFNATNTAACTVGSSYITL